MTPFPRQPEPSFWAEKERAWIEKAAVVSAAKALHGWLHEGRSLAWWFHRRVRPPREPELCAYCDGQLGATSPPSIDHHVPLAQDPSLGLRWLNLFPICTTCNSTYKRDAWSAGMIRPDTEWVVGWFSVTWRGEIEPAAGLDAVTGERVRRTIAVLGLNAKERCLSRRRVLERALELIEGLGAPGSRQRLGRLKRLMKLLRGGPYRFVSRQAVLQAAPELVRSPGRSPHGTIPLQALG